MRKKAPIWEVFFAYQNLWSQHFLHDIKMINMDHFMLLIVNLLIKKIYLVMWIQNIAKSLSDKNFLNTQEKRKKAPIWDLSFAC